MFTQFRLVDTIVVGQTGTELLNGITFFGAWQTSDDIAGQTGFVGVSHLAAKRTLACSTSSAVP